MTADPGAELPWERPLGARPIDADRTAFRVWAPRAEHGVGLVLGDRELAMEDVGHGVFELEADAPAGTDYWFAIDGERLADPCSRWQPEGVTGPSRVAGIAGLWAGDPPGRFRPVPLAEQVIYELHIGTFSPEGTFAGAIPHLAGLAELGVTAVEVMPVGEFPGDHGWGYDGVFISAVQSSYGGPAGLAAFVAAAHDCGLAVLLDVVYNHVGPGSDVLERFGPYFTDAYSTPWGSAINYDGPDSGAVREWACQSAEGFVADYGIDGLRLDAVHAIVDADPEHLVAELTRRVNAIDPAVLIISESALNDPKVMRPPGRGGWGNDAAWADDFHHAVRTLVSDEHEGYYADFGRVADLAKALHRPFVYDGTYSAVHRKRVGAPAGDLPASAFVVCSQNHDQVGNRAFGDRMPEAARPLAALLTLLSPFTPMLFMGEEYSEPAPFQYFCDHVDPQIAEATRQGRRAEFAAFASFGHEIPDPMDPATFRDSKLTRRGDPEVVALYRSLLELRRELVGTEAAGVTFDEAERWLTFRRGPVQILANFGDGAREFDAAGYLLRLATGPQLRIERDTLAVPPLGGAVLMAIKEQ